MGFGFLRSNLISSKHSINLRKIMLQIEGIPRELRVQFVIAFESRETFQS